MTHAQARELLMKIGHFMPMEDTAKLLVSETTKAYRAGMTDAAEIAQSRRYNGVDSYGHAFVEGCHTVADDIRKARDKIV